MYLQLIYKQVIMNIKTILHSFFEKSSFNAIKDQRRLNAVVDCSQALCNNETLTLTGIGRGMLDTTTKVKHNIKRVCRLLGNHFLYLERFKVYGFLSHALLKNMSHPLIIVDWSPVNHTDKQILRASMPVGGRSFTLYEEVHPESKLGSLKVHRAFIRRLAAFMPEGVIPIITTDAGFKVPWFKPVEEQGWYWLGRMRGNSKIKVQNSNWLITDELFSMATVKPTHLGAGLLTMQHQHACQMILYKKPFKGRKDKNLKGETKRDSASREYAKGQREPWLLVTNLPQESWFAQRVVTLYTQRMQIEVFQSYCLHKFQVIFNCNQLSLHISNIYTALRLYLIGCILCVRALLYTNLVYGIFILIHFRYQRTINPLFWSFPQLM